MDRLLPTLIVGGVIVLLVVLMAWGWRSRQRRQTSMVPPASAESVSSTAAISLGGWYVATTHGGQPLERVAVHGLGFRARASVAVHAEGVVFSVRGRTPFLVSNSELRGAGRATWAIDRVVEKDGLVMVSWMLGTTAVDTYLRLPSDSDAAAFVRMISVISPTIPTEPVEDPAS